VGTTHLDLPWLCASPYSLELRLQAVESYRRSGRPLTEIARDLGVPAEALARWVERAELEPERRDELTSEELEELRRENRALREELERARALSSKP
jgi:transposase